MDIEERPFSEKTLEGVKLGKIRITPEQRLYQAIEWGRRMLQPKIRIKSLKTLDKIEIDYGR